jgi:hypothetical protein
MTFTVMVGDKYELVTPTQDTFLLIIIQFCLILLINKFYLKQKVTRSDIIAFFIILIGFFVSFLHVISKLFKIPVPEHSGTDNPDTVGSTLTLGTDNGPIGPSMPQKPSPSHCEGLKVERYNSVVKTGEIPIEYSEIEE